MKTKKMKTKKMKTAEAKAEAQWRADQIKQAVRINQFSRGLMEEQWFTVSSGDYFWASQCLYEATEFLEGILSENYVIHGKDAWNSQDDHDLGLYPAANIRLATEEEIEHQKQKNEMQKAKWKEQREEAARKAKDA